MSSEQPLFIRLYIDEDVHESLALALRKQGHDALSVREAGQRGRSDPDQLAYAAQQNRALFSFNATDYIALHLAYLDQGKPHAGIIVAKQMAIGVTLRGLLTVLDQVSADEIRNQLRWLSAI